jgi:hypothetical protein
MKKPKKANGRPKLYNGEEEMVLTNFRCPRSLLDEIELRNAPHFAPFVVTGNHRRKHRVPSGDVSSER